MTTKHILDPLQAEIKADQQENILTTQKESHKPDEERQLHIDFWKQQKFPCPCGCNAK